MYDTWEYAIPKNTTEASLIHEPVHISTGIITDIYVGFPSGCGVYDSVTKATIRLARCRLLYLTSPVVPRTPKAFLGADGFTIHAGPLNFPILEGNPILDWQLWNLDDTYEHELWLGVNWLTLEELQREAIALDRLNMSVQRLDRAIREALLGESVEE